MDQRTKIKILLLKENIRQQDLVRKYGFPKGTVSEVISGRRKTRRIRKAIARELGVPVAELFERDGKGNRKGDIETG